MSRIIFVTTELDPERPGGAGVVVDALARHLGESRSSVVLLLGSEPIEVAPRSPVRVVTATIPETGFLERSQATAEALSDLVEPGDRVEFHDFEGIGFHSLLDRPRYGMDQAVVSVRFHGPYDLLAEAMETRPDDWDIPIAMEQEVFRMADVVLIPVEGHRETMIRRYGVEDQRILVSPPPVPSLNRVTGLPSDPPVFAVVGRLGEMKGSQDMVRAALALLNKGIVLKVRFIGSDGWSTTNNSWMRPWLESLIGPTHREAFEFVDALPRQELPKALADVTAVVVPSRFESFCLAAYEARQLGHGVVVPDIPAFRGQFDEPTGALVYDGTVEGLASALKRLITEPGVAIDLGRSGTPTLADPWRAYSAAPPVRHPRSQGGLATSAVKHIEAVMKAAIPPPSLIQRIYKVTPPRLVSIAYKVFPRSLQRWIAERASWHNELERRELESELSVYVDAEREALESRLLTVKARIAAGEFEELNEPQVTVVIPFFNAVEFIDETLASVYEQDFPSWEMVLVDDGSTDPASLSYLRRLKRPRLNVIRQANRGLSGARNTGFKMARGKYVVPLDADDQIDPTYLTRMVAALESNPRAGFAHCYARLHHDIDALFLTRPFNQYWQLLSNDIAFGLVRRDAWEQVGGYNEVAFSKGHEDWEFWLRLAGSGWEQVHVHEVLYKYRKHGVSMSVTSESLFEEVRKTIRDLHPDLYSPAGMRRIKDQWYPYVTVVSGTRKGRHPDIEVVDSIGGLASSWGKYVADARGLDPFPADLILSMADLLEASPKAATACTAGDPPLLVRRRWNLHDRGAKPFGTITLEDTTSGSGLEMPTHIARDGWEIPQHLIETGLPIQRQAPEEAGRLVDPMEW